MRRILVVTSGRADASPLRPVIEALGHAADVADLEGCSSEEAVSQISWEFKDDHFDAMLVLGDRYEILAACLAATYARIPIAHIHGGEASFGSFDNQIRDAITKLAHIHFVAAEPMRQRLLALGEEPHRIHVTGAPGLDNLGEVLAQPRRPKKYFVVTWHSETLGDDRGLDALIAALTRFEDYQVLWTGVNNDPGATEIERKFIAAKIRLSRLTPEAYVNACRHAAAVIGNSSSGIIEAPTLGVPTVNVGSRQSGRLKGPSVFDCDADVDCIENAILCALEYKGPFDNPYGCMGASAKIAGILKYWQPNMRKEWVS